MGFANAVQTADPVVKKLVHVLGPERASALITDILRRIGLASVETPEDRYKFAVELMKQGGMYEAIGRSIKIQAILLGAKET
jgi:hypothetical protein